MFDTMVNVEFESCLIRNGFSSFQFMLLLGGDFTNKDGTGGKPFWEILWKSTQNFPSLFWQLWFLVSPYFLLNNAMTNENLDKNI